ncbi:MAG: hypothetical protein VR72_16910 [Clostridiaceae bacterium BRH_c20a]|nr:MAG: hypothetical protein VR72_16910 [Clostridiaceae bacterium BRH_c20a]
MFSLPSFAAENSSVQLTENQKNILKAHGMTDEEVNNVTQDEIRHALSTPIKDYSVFGFNASPKGEVLSKEIEQKLIKKGLKNSEIEFLHKLGYMYNEILLLDQNIIKNELSKSKNNQGHLCELHEHNEQNSFETEDVSISSTTCPVCGGTHPVPSNLGYVYEVPYGGGMHEYFHSNIYVRDVPHNAEMSRYIAEKLFKTTFNGSSSDPNIRFSYYLWGEWGECYDYYAVHEGVDFQNKHNLSSEVYLLTPGKIVLLDRTKKWLSIYDKDLGVTVNYQHLSNIPSNLVQGQELTSAFIQIGTQNSSDRHIHVQVCSHTECQTVHSGYDTSYNLTCIKPYSYLYWYI